MRTRTRHAHEGEKTVIAREIISRTLTLRRTRAHEKKTCCTRTHNTGIIERRRHGIDIRKGERLLAHCAWA